MLDFCNTQLLNGSICYWFIAKIIFPINSMEFSENQEFNGNIEEKRYFFCKTLIKMMFRSENKFIFSVR